MPTWLVTGGAGYIGAHVARALTAAGLDAVVYDDLSTLVQAGNEAGDLRADITPAEISASLIGIFTVSQQAAGTIRADRLLDLLLDGLRARPAPRH